MKPTHIVIHHSLTNDGVLSDFAAIRRYHIEHNGWKDIGYHLVVEEVDGKLVLEHGREIGTVGAHCIEMGMNEKSIGICVVGNFDIAPPGITKMYFLRDLCFALMVNYYIPASNVLGHRDVGLMANYDWRLGEYKSCPGKLFDMDMFREMLSYKIDGR